MNNVIYWLILNSSKAPEAAWEYVKFLSGPEVQRIISESGNDVPILKSVMNSSSFENPDLRPDEKVYIQALANSRPFPIVMDVRIDGLIGDTVSAINLKQKTVPQGLQEVARQIDKHLAER